MNKHNRTCVKAGWWYVSVMSSSARHDVELSVYRFREDLLQQRGIGRMVYAAMNGQHFATSDEAFAAALAHGYLHHYGRNTCRFVQSRAARRRGYAPMADYRYASTAEQHARAAQLAKGGDA